MNNLIYCELFPFHIKMPTLTEEINSSFSDSGDKNVDALNDDSSFAVYKGRFFF